MFVVSLKLILKWLLNYTENIKYLFWNFQIDAIIYLNSLLYIIHVL